MQFTNSGCCCFKYDIDIIFSLILFNVSKCWSDKQEVSYTSLSLSTKYIVWNIIWFICKSSLWKFHLVAGLLMNLSVHADMIPFPLGLRHEMKWRVGDGILYKLGLTIMLHPGESISRIRYNLHAIYLFHIQIVLNMFAVRKQLVDYYVLLCYNISMTQLLPVINSLLDNKTESFLTVSAIPLKKPGTVQVFFNLSEILVSEGSLYFSCYPWWICNLRIQVAVVVVFSNLIFILFSLWFCLMSQDVKVTNKKWHILLYLYLQNISYEILFDLYVSHLCESSI